MTRAAPDGHADLVLPVPTLRGWVADCFEVAGMSAEDAGTLADSLLFAERRGVVSHGLSRVPVYVRRLRAGGLNPRPECAVRISGAVAVVDGDFGPGAVVARRAARVAADLAQDHGIGLVAVRDVGHVGALAFYVQDLAERGLVAIALGNADPIMVPPGGGRAVLGSNPVALAVPPVAGAAPLLDMATTAAAHGKIVMAEARGAPIPSGWAVDAAGQETTVAAQALAGALLPAAGPKGFGLSFFVDVLCAGLAGGRTGSAIVPLYESPGQPQGATFVVIAIDPDHAAGAGELGRATSEVAAAVRAAGPDGSRPPMIPGEPERRREVEAGNELRVPREVVEQLDAVRPDVPLPRPPC